MLKIKYIFHEACNLLFGNSLKTVSGTAEIGGERIPSAMAYHITTLIKNNAT